MQRVEFTIEPFVEGHPGRHVTESISAVRDLGVEVDVGPFGSGCSVDDEDAAAGVAAAIVRAAFAHGATHLNIDVSADDGSRGGA